jgi:enoyl-CoA hydratase/carnithine racemase
MEPATPRELVTYEVEGAIAKIGLNRPEKLNAMSSGLLRQLASALERFDLDDNLAVAVLFGHGRAFSSGADVTARHHKAKDEPDRPDGPGQYVPYDELVHRCLNWKPLVAAVHGYALGAGLGLALSCDVVVAAIDAKLQVTETRLGLSPIRFWALLDLHGPGAFAVETALTGRMFTGQEAADARVIASAVAPGTELDAAVDIASAIATNPARSVRAGVRARRWALAERERLSHSLAEPLHLHPSGEPRRSN